jgi:ankyrin repeat protein
MPSPSQKLWILAQQKGLEILQHRDVISERLFVDILTCQLSDNYFFAAYDTRIARITEVASFFVKESSTQPPQGQVQHTDAVYALCVAESSIFYDDTRNTEISSKEIRRRILYDALIAVSFLGNLAMVRYLLGEGADSLATYSCYGPPLVHAARQGHNEIIQVLLENKADLNVDEHFWNGRSSNASLNRASRNGHLDTIKLLLDQSDVILSNEGDPIFAFALAVLQAAIKNAAKAGHQSVIQYLMQRPELYGYVPFKNDAMLHSILLSGIRGSQKHIVQWMLDLGVDVNMKRGHEYEENDNDLTVLQIAALRGRAPIVQLLLDNGVDRKTPALSSAARNGHLDVARLLLDYPGDVNMEHMLVGIEDFGPGLTYTEPPLYEAARAGHVPMVRLLLERGKNIHVPWTCEALQAAMEQGNDDIVMALVQAGVNVDCLEPGTTKIAIVDLVEKLQATL